MTLNKKRLAIYGVGGFGLNLIFDHLAVRYPDTKFNAIDSSISNTPHQLPNNVSFYKVDGVNGSGGLQSQNLEVFDDAVPDIFNEHRPALFNIVIFSSTGGTGASLGNLMVRHLLSKGENVIAIVLTSAESRRRLINAKNVINSMELVSSDTGRPYICHLVKQEATDQYEVADKQAFTSACNLINLLDNDYAGLDETDIVNFINYDRVTTVEPQLALLSFRSTTKESITELNRGKPIIAYLSLLPSDVTNLGITVSVANDTGGMMPGSVVGRDNGLLFIIESETKHEVLKGVLNDISEFNTTASVTVNKRINTNREKSVGGIVIEK